MNKNVKRFIELIIVIAIVVGSYFYKDIEKYINNFTQSNIKSVVSGSDNLEIYYLDVLMVNYLLIILIL